MYSSPAKLRNDIPLPLPAQMISTALAQNTVQQQSKLPWLFMEQVKSYRKKRQEVMTTRAV